MKTMSLIGAGLCMAALAVSGCGGGSSATPAATTTTITGIASKGPINKGEVKVFAVRNGVEDRSAPLGQGQTDATGHYSIDVGSYKGPVMVEVKGGTFTDEVAGTTVALNTPMRAVFGNASTGQRTVAVTPLTELGCKKAKRAGAALTKSSIDDANSKMASKFKLADIVGTVPVAGGSSDDQKKYAAACGSISQMVNNSKHAGESLDDALSRVMGEMETEIENSGDLSDDSTTKLNTAVDDFNKGGKNSSGTEGTHVDAPSHT